MQTDKIKDKEGEARIKAKVCIECDIYHVVNG
jgi:hypothetical protein